MARRREVRDDQHGTSTGYAYGCRCDACRDARRDKSRMEREKDPVKHNERNRDWYRRNRQLAAAHQVAYLKANPDVVARNKKQLAKRQAESVAGATRRKAQWEPYEDALLARIPSNIAAASALGRTIAALQNRRSKLRAKAAL